MSGRQAIDEALERLYVTEKDFRFKLFPEAGEEAAPLDEIVAFRASKPIPHWHYVTYGLSELDEKQSADPALSGYGVEYTLRLVNDAETPPFWPMNLLRWVAKVVWDTRAPLDPKHTMEVPIRLLEQVFPSVEGLGAVEDPDLGKVATSNGSVTFVGLIPLVEREWWLVGAWDFDKYTEAVLARQSDLLWRAGRPSVLDGDPGEEVLARALREGSSVAANFTDLEWTDEEIVLDPIAVGVMVRLLRHRIAYGRDSAINDGERRATFSAGDWHSEYGSTTCAVAVPVSEAEALAEALWDARPEAVVSRPNGVRFRMVAAYGAATTDR